MSTRFRPGIEALLGADSRWIAGCRVGLVTHAAAVNADGLSSVQLLAAGASCRLTALFGPEHGLFGTASAGQSVRTARHPDLKIPIYSLYGRRRKPTSAMLRDLDTIVFDLQDLGVRCYTYVSTLRLVMEAAAEHGLRLIVADRPTPFACTVDGPVTEPECESFVSLVPTPMVYGLTPGETALWLKQTFGLVLDLKIARMRGYRRETLPKPGWPPWMPPSPGITSRESALCYPAVVSAEAFSVIDDGRGTQLPFQIFSVTGGTADRLCTRLAAENLPGINFTTVHCPSPANGKRSRLTHGIRLTVTNPARFRPCTTAAAILAAVQKDLGKRRLWEHPGTRTDFFDRLWGTRSVRKALQAGRGYRAIAEQWTVGLAAFRRARKRVLLYRRSGNTGTRR